MLAYLKKSLQATKYYTDITIVSEGVHFFINESREIYEQEDFLRRCHAGYLSAIEFLKSKGRNIVVIDGEGSVEEVAGRVKKFFQ